MRTIIVLRTALLSASLVAAAMFAPAPAESQLAGKQPDNLNESKQYELIKALEAMFPESKGFRVNAPLGPVGGTPGDLARLVGAFRVIVPQDVTVTQGAQKLISGSSPFVRYVDIEQDTGFRPEIPVGYAGVPVTAKFGNKIVDVQFLTVNMDRWLIWARECYFPIWKGDRDTPIQEYAAAVSQYLRKYDFGDEGVPPLETSTYGAPKNADLFGGYDPKRHEAQTFQEISQSCKEMDLDIADGVTDFTAGERAVEWLVDHRGKSEFRDRSQADLQQAFYNFANEGRDVRELRALTPQNLEEVEPGRYFYAVDVYGRARFGRMHWTPDQGQQGIWRERLKSYECLLFPGEPIVAAGEFQIATDDGALEANLDGAAAPTRRLASVNAFSSYYYYRPDENDLEGQIEGKSDDYVKNIGHLFKALQDMGVDIREPRISKF
jgi:hypothetical protein